MQRRQRPASRLPRYTAEALLALSALSGWALLTWGVAELVTVWVWPLSAGVVLLGLAGYRLLFTVLSMGLYTLSRDD